MKHITASTTLGIFAAAIVSLGGSACGGSHDDVKSPTPEVTNVSSDPPSASTSPVTAGAADAGAGAVGSSETLSADAGAPGASAANDAPLTDAQIAQVASDANNGEIEAGKYAAAHAKSASVKRFAAHMVTMHSEIGKKMGAALHAQNITPADSPRSTQLKTDSKQTLDTLKSQRGADFDKSYMDSQVKAHQNALDTFDNTLIPNAKNAALKAELTAVRPQIAKHLKDAQDIQASLAQGH